MNSARDLFDKLVSFKQVDDPTTTPSKKFLAYCTQVLGAVERDHVDFKQKRNRSHPKLDDDDKRNLARAVSGFANSGGGVLIWGIEDKTLAEKPITDVQRFVSNLLELAPQVADPIVPGIDGDWIPGDTPAEGFGVIFIPESTLPPHRVILNYDGIKNHYFIRSGDSFLVSSHTLLEDMFGRRPKPELTFSKRVVLNGIMGGSVFQFYVILGIENKGRGAAKSPFLAVSVKEPYKISDYGIDGNRGFGLRRLTKSLRADEDRYGSSQDVVIHPGIVHDVTAVKAEADVRKPRYEVPDLVIDYKMVAEGVQLIEGQAIIKGVELFAATEHPPFSG